MLTSLSVVNPDRREFHAYPVPTFSAWTVRLVREALDEHEAGQFAASSLLAEHLHRNPRIGGAVNTRILACTGLPFALEAGDGDGRRNDPAVAKLKAHWESILPLSTQAEILRWLLTLGVAFGELVWRVAEDGSWVPRLKVWHPSFFQWVEHERRYYVNTVEGWIPIAPGDGHWCVFGYTSERPWMRGVVRCLALEDTIRGLAVRDWARFSEIHGVPIRLAKVPFGAPEAQAERFVSDLSAASLGADTTLLTRVDKDGAGFGLELVEAKDQAYEAFLQLIAQCDSDVAIAILGQTFTTEQTKGVYVAQANGSGVRRDLTEADCNALAWDVREQIAKPWARYNLGENHLDSAPRACWNTKPAADLAAESTTVKTLGEGLAAMDAALAPSGKRVDTIAMAGRFGIPVIDAPKPDPLKPGVDEHGHPLTPAQQSAGAPDRNVAAPARPGVPGLAGKASQPSGTPGPGSKKLAMLSTDPRGDNLLAGQTFADAVADAAMRKAPAAVDPMLQALVSEVDASTSYEDLRVRLAALLARADTSKAQRLMRAAILMAEAAGTWSAHPGE